GFSSAGFAGSVGEVSGSSLFLFGSAGFSGSSLLGSSELGAGGVLSSTFSSVGFSTTFSSASKAAVNSSPNSLSTTSASAILILLYLIIYHIANVPKVLHYAFMNGDLLGGRHFGR